MKPILAIILIAALPLSGCSRTKPEPSVQAAIPSARASEPTAALYPPIDADAKGGEVLEYY
jgi:hypothetical protein